MPSSSAIPSDTNKECTEEKEEGQVEKERLNNARKRKRRVDKKGWETEKNKSKREKRQKYYGLKKNAEGNWVIDQKREARKLKPFCNCKQSAKTTKIQCRKFTEDDRLKIFNHFWKESNWSQSRTYVANLSIVLPQKTKRIKLMKHHAVQICSFVSLKEMAFDFECVQKCL